jgi:hypothetical protein
MISCSGLMKPDTHLGAMVASRPNASPDIRQMPAGAVIRGMRKRKADPLIESAPNTMTIRMVPFINFSVALARGLTSTLIRARLPHSLLSR